MLRSSIFLNLLLLGGLILVLAHPREKRAGRAPAPPETETRRRAPAPAVAAPRPPSGPGLNPFLWTALEATNDYRKFVANLRAIGCPDATVEDIVKGDAARAFAWERRQLGLDGAGSGPWSRLREAQLVASLLGKNSATERGNAGTAAGWAPASAVAETGAAGQIGPNPDRWNRGNGPVRIPVPAPGAAQNQASASPPSHPLFLQDVNWKALGFDADERQAIAQARQQFIAAIGGPDQNPTGPAYLARWQKAATTAADTLRGALGAQSYEAYLDQQYYEWYQPQVVAANAQGQALTINPDAFSLSR